MYNNKMFYCPYCMRQGACPFFNNQFRNLNNYDELRDFNNYEDYNDFEEYEKFEKFEPFYEPILLRLFQSS